MPNEKDSLLPSIVFTDREERLQILHERMLFHSRCSSDFIKLFNSDKVEGPVNEPLRNTLSHAINYHMAMHVRMYLKWSTLKYGLS